MSILETRRYAMLVRVRDFGEARAGIFPESSAGGQAFAAVTAAVAKLNTHARLRLPGPREGHRARIAAREALVDRLGSIARTARAIAEQTPGFDDPFRLPKRQDEGTLLTAAQVFVEDAESRQARFVGHGLPQTFVADLRALTERFEATVQASAAAKERRRVAQKGMAAAIVSGLAAVRQLDVIVVNQLEHDLDGRSQWEEARKVDYPRRRRPAPAAGSDADGPRPPVVAMPASGPPPATTPGTGAPAPAGAAGG